MSPSLIGIKTIYDGATDNKHRIISVHLVQYFWHLVTDSAWKLALLLDASDRTINCFDRLYSCKTQQQSMFNSAQAAVMT